MESTAYLLLEDGRRFDGVLLGKPELALGEVVFNTCMTGYQEVLTDPSYTGQLVTMTYPLIGNYGVNQEDRESPVPQVAGFVVREASRLDSSWRSNGSLDAYLKEHGLLECYSAQELKAGLCHIDRLLMVDRQEGFVNSPSFEYLARKCYGLEMAFRRCRVKSDWCRTGGQKGFKSKVDWPAAKRVDPSYADAHKLRIRPVEDEIRSEMERDACTSTWRPRSRAGARTHPTV